MPMRYVCVFFALLSILCMATTVHAEQNARIVHFVVVNPAVDGVDHSNERAGLEKLFLRLAGGFTDMGRTRGGELREDSIKREANIAYMVAAKKDVSNEIHDYVLKHFQRIPYILTWPAEVFSPPSQ